MRISDWRSYVCSSNLKMPRSYRVPLALAVGALIGASITLTQGVLADKATKPTAETLNFKDLQTFVEILNRVKSDYVEPVEDKTLIENAVRGMLAGLDPHSAYLDEDEFKDMNVITTGKFGGLGIEEIGRESCRERVCQYV